MVTEPVSVKFKVSGLTRDMVFGGRAIHVIAGPCSIESEAHLHETALAVKAAGATFLRGGIFKMRTKPSSFQGLGANALPFIRNIKTSMGLPFVSEVTDPRQVSDLAATVDLFQVGSRNMYNYELLKELGRLATPVLLKRAFAATVDEWIKAAEYVTSAGGGAQVILCERGIRTFEPTTRNTLDLNSVAYLKAHTTFPVVVDPSHGTGRPELIKPMTLAAIAAGADGIIIETHPRPKEALSDADQAIDFEHFGDIVSSARKVALALGRELENPQ